MHITKTLNLAATELKFNAETGTFKGYASVWDGVDSYGDTLKKGAYLDTLRDHGLPKMFFQHKWDMPVGKYTHADEDSKGLWVEGELTPNHSLASDVRAAMLHETLDGLSVGGILAKSDFKSTDQGGRVIHKWTKLVEVSPVVFPADNAARIASVKNIDFEALLPECKTERDIEKLLRDSGLGKWEAMAVISRVKAIFEGRDSQDDADTKTAALILERLQKIAS